MSQQEQVPEQQFINQQENGHLSFQYESSSTSSQNTLSDTYRIFNENLALYELAKEQQDVITQIDDQLPSFEDSFRENFALKKNIASLAIVAGLVLIGVDVSLAIQGAPTELLKLIGFIDVVALTLAFNFGKGKDYAEDESLFTKVRDELQILRNLTLFESTQIFKRIQKPKEPEILFSDEVKLEVELKKQMDQHIALSMCYTDLREAIEKRSVSIVQIMRIIESYETLYRQKEQQEGFNALKVAAIELFFEYGTKSNVLSIFAGFFLGVQVSEYIQIIANRNLNENQIKYLKRIQNKLSNANDTIHNKRKSLFKNQ